MSAPSAMHFAFAMQSLQSIHFAGFASPSAVPTALLFPPASPELQQRIRQQWACLYQWIPVEHASRLALFSALAALAREVQACSSEMREQDARLLVLRAIKQDAAVGGYAQRLGRRWARVNLLFANQIDCDFWLGELGPQPKLSENFLQDLQQHQKEWRDLKPPERHAHWRQKLEKWAIKDEDGSVQLNRHTDDEASSAPASPAKLGASSSATTVTDPRSSCSSESPNKKARVTPSVACHADSAPSAAATPRAPCFSSAAGSSASSSTKKGDDAETKMTDTPVTDHVSFRGSPKEIDADRDSDAEQGAAASDDQVDDPFAEPEASESDNDRSDAHDEKKPAPAASAVRSRRQLRTRACAPRPTTPSGWSDVDEERDDPFPAAASACSSAPAAAAKSTYKVRADEDQHRRDKWQSDAKAREVVRNAGWRAKFRPKIDAKPEIHTDILREWLSSSEGTVRERSTQDIADITRRIRGVFQLLPSRVYQQWRKLHLTTSFVKTLRPTQRLSCILPFVSDVEAALLDPSCGAVRICHVRGELDALELTPEAYETSNYDISSTRVMNFGCANNNGADPTEVGFDDIAALAAALTDQIHVSATCEELQSVLTEQWLCASHPRRLPAPVLPSMYAGRFYLKDGSENGGLTVPDMTEGVKEQRVSIPFFPRFEEKLRELTGESTADGSGPSRGDRGKDEEKQVAVAPPVTWTDALRNEFHSHRASQRRRYLAVDKQHANKGYFVHPLYLNELQLHRRSLAPLAHVDFDGVNTSYIYLKHGFQFFNLHIEQMLFTFVHEQLEGESTWFIVPFSQLTKLYRLAAEMYAVLWGEPDDATDEEMMLMGRAVLYSKQLFPPLSLLEELGIRYNVVHLGPGQTLTAHGGDAHFGFSTEAIRTVSIATNVASESWLKYGLTFVREHFEWIKRVEPIVDKHEKAWGKSGKPGPFTLPEPEQGAVFSSGEVLLHGPKACFEKALNLCPSNFACAFVRGLYADFDAMLHGNKPVCDYPKMHDELKADGQRRAAAKEQLEAWSDDCVAIVELIHELRPIVKRTDTNHCGGCNCKTLRPNSHHTCMLCLCCMGTESNKMLVDAEPRPPSPEF